MSTTPKTTSCIPNYEASETCIDINPQRTLNLVTALIPRCFTQDESFLHPRSLGAPHCTSLVTGAFVLRDESTLATGRVQDTRSPAWPTQALLRLPSSRRREGRCCWLLAAVQPLLTWRASRGIQCKCVPKGQKVKSRACCALLQTQLSKVLLVSG